MVYEKDFHECFFEKDVFENLKSFIGNPVKIWMLTATGIGNDTLVIKLSVGEEVCFLSLSDYEYDYELNLARLKIDDYSEVKFWEERASDQKKAEKLFPEAKFSPEKFVKAYSGGENIKDIQIVFDEVWSSYLCDEPQKQRTVSVKLHRGFLVQFENESIPILIDDIPFFEAHLCKGEIDWANFSTLPYTGCPNSEGVEFLKVERKLISLDTAMEQSLKSIEKLRKERYTKSIEEKFCGKIIMEADSNEE